MGEQPPAAVSQPIAAVEGNTIAASSISETATLTAAQTTQDGLAMDLLQKVDLHPHLLGAVKKEPQDTGSETASNRSEPLTYQEILKENLKLTRELQLVSSVSIKLQDAFELMAEQQSTSPPTLILTQEEAIRWSIIVDVYRKNRRETGQEDTRLETKVEEQKSTHSQKREKKRSRSQRRSRSRKRHKDKRRRS